MRMRLSTQGPQVPVIPKALEGRVEGHVSQRPVGYTAWTQAQANESCSLLLCYKSNHLSSLLMSAKAQHFFPVLDSLYFILFGKI